MINFILKIFQILFSRPVLPHPHEPQNTSQTVATINKPAVLGRWLTGWQVPVRYHDHWLNAISLYVYDQWPPEILSRYSNVKPETPGFALSEEDARAVYVLASWLTPGVVAHEQAHNSWALLSDYDRTGFEAFWKSGVYNYEPLVQLLMKTNQYWKTSIVETHAEVYRYLGEKMPESLKRFYPKLF
jgi:hypothetical protein